MHCTIYMIKLTAMVVAVLEPSTTAILNRVYYLTLPTSLCCDDPQNLQRSSVEQIPRQFLHTKSKLNMLENIKTLISAKSVKVTR